MLLTLTRQAGGRSWRLADVCTACAAATGGTAVVPDTLLGAPRPKPTGGTVRRARPGLSPGPDERARVREMLTYLSAALPQFTSPAARLLALQCALRADTLGHVTVSDGLLRSMRLRGRRELWLELAQARWLKTAGPRPGPVTARLLDTTVLDQAPGRGARRRAAHWALHPTPLALSAEAPAVLQLTALVLASHPFNTEELGAVSHLCGHSPQQTAELLDRLVSAHTLVSWRHCQDTGEVLWQFPQQPPRCSPDRDR
ncbi:hypothetical protein [Streptomyces sp. x-45]|uniref:hypothetical protein n=1 Tax=Streptomyces sp. x-45 TaxID=2789281 RepID=UPI00397F101A